MEIVCRLIAYRRFKSSSLRQKSLYFKGVQKICPNFAQKIKSLYLLKINTHPHSGWFYIFGHSPYLQATHKCVFFWPASHALFTCYPSTGRADRICSVDLLLYRLSTDLQHILVSLLYFSLPCLRNILCTKIRGFGMQISYL